MRLKSLPGAETIPLVDGELVYLADYVADPDALKAALLALPGWYQPQLQVFGKYHATPRRVHFVGDAGVQYRYSGHLHRAEGWPPGLAALRDRLEEDCGERFNCALLNHYRDGNDTMGYHSDDEPALGDNPTVASVSLGAERDFALKPKRGGRAQTLPLASGALLLMLPPIQRYWRHALPKRAGVDAERVNITFRRIID